MISDEVIEFLEAFNIELPFDIEDPGLGTDVYGHAYYNWEKQCIVYIIQLVRDDVLDEVIIHFKVYEDGSKIIVYFHYKNKEYRIKFFDKTNYLIEEYIIQL